jgi:hypothetical protein
MKIVLEVTDVGSTTRTTRATLDSTGQFQFSDGSVSLPGISFQSDTDTGIYRIGADNLGVAVGGTKILDVASTGLSVIGTITTSATTFLHRTTGTLADGAAAAAGTLLNAPAAGNPTKWIPIDDNGTTRYIPAW